MPLVSAGQLGGERFAYIPKQRGMSQHFVALSSVRSIFIVLFRQPKGDFAERLATKSVLLLTILSAVLISSSFFADPITCWTRAEYEKQWVKFVDNYCYVQGTYYVPMNSPLPWDANKRRRIAVDYYQWVPYVFAIQAFAMYLPKTVWRLLCALLGFDVPEIIRHIDKIWREACASDNTFVHRQRIFENAGAPLVWDSLHVYRARYSTIGRLPLMALCYVFAKFVFALNTLLLWLWLNSFFNSHVYNFWGLNILKDLIRGISWQDSGHFPRIVQCDFNRRAVAATQLESVTCVLTMNVYYEKIFLFLWFWLAAVAFCNIISFLYWFWIVLFPKGNTRLFRDYLNSMRSQENNGFAQPSYMAPPPLTPPMEITSAKVSHHSVTMSDRSDSVTNLLHNHIRMDGVFVIRLISVNVGDLPAAYLARAMHDLAMLGPSYGRSSSKHKLHSPPSPIAGTANSSVVGTPKSKMKGSKEV